jgi:hypothetical protein
MYSSKIATITFRGHCFSIQERGGLSTIRVKAAINYQIKVDAAVARPLDSMQGNHIDSS